MCERECVFVGVRGREACVSADFSHAEINEGEGEKIVGLDKPDLCITPLLSCDCQALIARCFKAYYSR